MTFAILPPNFLLELSLLLASLVLSASVCFALFYTKTRIPRFVRVCLAGIGCMSVGILMSFLLFPSVARIERLNYQGHDQFYWGNRLQSDSPEARREAANALAAILKMSTSNVRILAIQDLGDCRAEEREIACNALLELAKNEQENEHLRRKAEYAIGAMFFQHVVGDIGTEVDRDPFQKMILAHGWDAAARDFAEKKLAKDQKR